MSPDTPQDDHLAELRRRWEADPGSRLYLQLAEEYRRAGRRDEALEVLQKGLERYPHQVSALVSLGRIHLESGRAAEAATALEKAVSMDATNMVAMKLAVEAYLQQGDRDQARQSLELYKLLNAGDPEVEELEGRLEGRPAETAPETVVTETPAEAAEAVETAATDAPRVPGTWSPTAAWPALPRDEEAVEGAETSAVPAPPPPAAPPPPPALAATQSVRHGEEDPFSELGTVELRRRYLSALGAGGIFALTREEATEPQPEPEPVAADAGEAEPPPVESVPESALGLEAAEGAEEAETWEAETWEDESTEEPADERPTVTLGQLYLDQGHFADAERIFEAVLARDADSVTARTGLLRARAAVAAVGADPGGQEPASTARIAEAAEWGAVSEGSPTFDAQTGTETAVAAQEAPPPQGFDLTAEQLLAGVETDDTHRALLLAYLDRLRGHGAGQEERGSDVS